MARGGELSKALLRQLKGVFRLFEALLLEERAPEHELRVADLVEVVDPPFEQGQGLAGLLLRGLGLADAEMNLGERGDGLCGIGVAADFERDAERVLEKADRLLRLAEQE